MRIPSLLLLPCLTVSATAQFVALQPLPARGMMPAFQAGMTFSHAPDTIVRKLPNLPVQLGTFAPGGPNNPKYDIDDIEAFILSRFEVSVDLDVDAMSTGNDLLPVVYDPDGHIYRIQSGNSNGWATLYLTRIDPNGNGGADIFGYYFDNPTFPSGLARRIYHEVIRGDYQTGPLAPPPTANIVAMDVNMGLIHSNQGFLESPVLPDKATLFLSLSTASAHDLEFWGVVTDPDPIDGAAIFAVGYDSFGQVQSFTLHCTGTDLGVPPQTNVDALGVAWVQQPIAATNPLHQPLSANSRLYILSFDDPLNGEEMFVSAKPQAPAGQPVVTKWDPLRTYDGLSLVGPNGRLAGKVKGVCAQDPDAAAGTHSWGVPGVDLATLEGIPMPPSTMNLSVTAVGNGPGQTAGDVFALHGVLSGGTYTGASIVGLFFTYPGGSFFNLLPNNRPAGGQPYSFQTPIAFPWYASFNEYEVILLTTPVSGSGFEVSTRSRLRRVNF